MEVDFSAKYSGSATAAMAVEIPKHQKYRCRSTYALSSVMALRLGVACIVVIVCLLSGHKFLHYPLRCFTYADERDEEFAVTAGTIR